MLSIIYLLCGEVDLLVPDESLLLLLDLDPLDRDLLGLADLDWDSDFLTPLCRLLGDATECGLDSAESLIFSFTSLLLLMSFVSLTIIGFSPAVLPLVQLNPALAAIEGVVEFVEAAAAAAAASDCDLAASKLLLEVVVPWRPNEPFL